MGGGGGRGGISPREYDEYKKKIIEAKAKQAIKEPAETGKKNVFISFANEDKNEVNLLRGQAKNENNELEFNDWSLKVPFDSEKADYIKRGITERIKQASVTMCFISEHTAPSKWVDWEIRKSLELGKKVFCVYKGDKAPSTLPSAVKEHNIKLVPWSHKHIGKAITDEAK